jgi:hypothetical protein
LVRKFFQQFPYQSFLLKQGFSGPAFFYATLLVKACLHIFEPITKGHCSCSSPFYTGMKAIYFLPPCLFFTKLPFAVDSRSAYLLKPNDLVIEQGRFDITTCILEQSEKMITFHLPVVCPTGHHQCTGWTASCTQRKNSCR